MKTSHPSGVRALGCDEQNVAKAVFVKACHGAQVGSQRLALPILQLLNQVLHALRDELLRITARTGTAVAPY
jgi:hypothetical protein